MICPKSRLWIRLLKIDGGFQDYTLPVDAIVRMSTLSFPYGFVFGHKKRLFQPLVFFVSLLNTVAHLLANAGCLVKYGFGKTVPVWKVVTTVHYTNLCGVVLMIQLSMCNRHGDLFRSFRLGHSLERESMNLADKQYPKLKNYFKWNETFKLY